MWKWLKNRTNAQSQPAQSPLKGAPNVPRTKSYSAETGYVYQYVYRGYRKFSDQPAGTDYVFSVTRDRKTVWSVTIRVSDVALADCAAASGREIANAERYALAKMTLFAAFDRITTAEEWQAPIVPSGAEMTDHLRALGRI